MVEIMRDLQKRIGDFTKKYALECSPELRMLDIQSELGEVAKELLKASNYGNKKTMLDTKALTEEIGDLLFSVLCLANSLDIDTESAVNAVLKKYEKRIRTNGKPGS